MNKARRPTAVRVNVPATCHGATQAAARNGSHAAGAGTRSLLPPAVVVRVNEDGTAEHRNALRRTVTVEPVQLADFRSER